MQDLEKPALQKLQKLRLERAITPKWNSKELEILQKLYPYASWKELLKALPGRTRQSILRKAIDLRIKRRVIPSWSSAEKETLKKFYPVLGWNELAKLLPGRTRMAIINAANNLRVRRIVHPKYWTQEQEKILQKAIATAPQVMRSRGEKKKFIEAIAQQIGKSWNAVNQKIERKYPDALQVVLPSRVVNDEIKILEYLSRRGETTVNELSKLIDKSAVEVVKILNKLRAEGYEINHDQTSKTVELIDDPTHELSPLELDAAPKLGTYRFGVIGETRCGSKYTQMTLLHTAYEIFKREKVQFVFHVGNLVAGMLPKRYEEELFLKSAKEQKEFVHKHYPRASFKTYIIAGQTDLSFRTQGYNIVKDICANREDLVYRGDELAKFFIRQSYEIDVIHLSTDNIPYAKSYRPQRIVEQIMANRVSLRGSGRKNPDLVLIGGVHTKADFPYGGPRVLIVPSFISQTPRQKRKGIAPTIGIWIVEVSQEEETQKWRFLADFRDLTHYQRRDDYLSNISIKAFEKLSREEKTILAILEDEGPQTLGECSRRLNRTKETVRKIIDKLTKRGLPIDIPPETKQVTLERKIRKNFSSLPKQVVDSMFEVRVSKVKLGIVADPHLIHKSQQPTILSKAYEIGDEEKVDVFLNAGDVTDGLGTVGYKGHWKDLIIPGADEQVEYVVKVYPKSRRPGVKTKIIPGNHDQWAQKSFGYNIVKHICGLRPDMECHKYPKDVVEINGFKIKLFHPAMGTAYALSYKVQNLIINDLRNQEPGVDVVVYGGWHKAFCMLYAGIHGFIAPCLKGPDEFFEEKGLPYAVGMWIIELTKDRHDRITRIVENYIDFLSLLKEKDY